MFTSRPGVTELSEFTTLSTAPIDGDSASTRVTIAYNNPKDLTRELPPSFKFFIIGLEKPIDLPMKYSEEKQQWEVSIDVSKDARGFFQVLRGEISLDKGNIGLTNGEPHPRIYKDASVPQGTLIKLLYKKDGSLSGPVPEAELKAGDRFITVYLPPGYKENRGQPYGLQIGLDGDDLRTMQANIMLDNMIEKKEIEPVVAIFIPPWHGPPDLKTYATGVEGPPGYCGDMRTKEYACNEDVAKDLAITLTKAVQKHFHFTADPEHTTITGVSISAEQALFMAMRYPNVFSSVIAQSPALHWSPNLLLMPKLPPVGQKSKQTSIVTPEGLFQVNEEKTKYECILDASELEKLGLTKLIHDGLKSNVSSFYHLLSLDQFRKLNQILVDKEAQCDMHGNGCSRWLTAMVKSRELKPDAELPLKIWLQAGKTEDHGTQPIKKTTDELASILARKGFNVVANVTHEGGHDYIEWRCGLPAAVIAMHQPVLVKVSEAKMTFTELQGQPSGEISSSSSASRRPR